MAQRNTVDGVRNSCSSQLTSSTQRLVRGKHPSWLFSVFLHISFHLMYGYQSGSNLIFYITFSEQIKVIHYFPKCWLFPLIWALISVKWVISILEPSFSVFLFVVFSQPLHSAHLLVLRSEPAGPSGPIIGPASDVLVCRALAASPALSAYGRASFSQMCLLCGGANHQFIPKASEVQKPSA